MPLISILELALVAVLMFFLPGFAVLLAFTGRESRFRQDTVDMIAASAGISLAIAVIILFLMTIIYNAVHEGLNVTAFVLTESALTAAMLLLSAVVSTRKRTGGGNNAER